MTESDRGNVFSEDICREMAGRDIAGYFRSHWRQDLPPVARLQLVDLRTFLPDLNLARADRTSMRVALELRVPLLNHKLVEYACGLRENIRTPEGSLKGLFKKAVSDRLPEEIRRRKKKGFSAPVKEWFTGEDLSRLAREVASDCPDIAGRWLAHDLPEKARRIRGSRAYKLWVFLQWIRTAA
jgi:asparagine synthase (glutamine-hydrolysing)